MRIAAALAVLLMLVPVCGGSLAQTTEPVSADPTATLVDELVVNASAPGPAWWKVSRGAATVFILGLPTLTPKKVEFDDALLRKRLEGANQLILAPASDVNLLGLVGFAFGARRTMGQSKPLSQTLPPAMADRLHLLLMRREQKPEALDKLKPAFAGFMLANSDDGKSLTIDVGGLQENVEKLSRSSMIHAHPRIVRTGRYDVLAQVKALAVLPADAQLVCFDDGLRTAENGQGGIKILAERWAEGRVQDLASADRGFEACLSGSPTVSADLRRGMDASTAAIELALRGKGTSVALVDLRPLLATNGVLDRLRHDGYEVRPPGG